MVMDKLFIITLEFIFLMGKKQGEIEAEKKFLIQQKPPEQEEYLHPFITSMGSSVLIIAFMMELFIIVNKIKMLLI